MYINNLLLGVWSSVRMCVCVCVFVCACVCVCVCLWCAFPVPLPPTDWQVYTTRSFGNDHGKPLWVCGCLCSGHGDQLSQSWQMHMHTSGVGHISGHFYRLCQQEPNENTALCNQREAANYYFVRIFVRWCALPNAVKDVVGDKRFPTFPYNTFRVEVNFVLSNWQRK